jgi:hypothetical protein
LRNENVTSDVSGDFEIVDLIEDSEGDKEEPYGGGDPYSFQ